MDASAQASASAEELRSPAAGSSTGGASGNAYMEDAAPSSHARHWDAAELSFASRNGQANTAAWLSAAARAGAAEPIVVDETAASAGGPWTRGLDASRRRCAAPALASRGAWSSSEKSAYAVA